MASINNNTIGTKLKKQVLDSSRMLQGASKKAVTLEPGLQLTKGVHLGRPSQVMLSLEMQKSRVVPIILMGVLIRYK